MAESIDKGSGDSLSLDNGYDSHRGNGSFASKSGPETVISTDRIADLGFNIEVLAGKSWRTLIPPFG